MTALNDRSDVMSGLKDFQRATVRHVMDRYFGQDPTRRFLVADETGLGKSVVARGVVSQISEKLQDDPDVQRIDIVYVCSNQDVARQNLAALNPFQDEGLQLSSRLTLLAKHVADLEKPSVDGRKAVRLVAFTPGTSFEPGWRTGKAEERALTYLILEKHMGARWDGWRRRAAQRALQATVTKLDNFRREIDRLDDELGGHVDRRITTVFLKKARAEGVLREFDRLLDDVGRRERLPHELRERAAGITGRLRACLAQAGVDVLEPDLVIVDEFQRFRHLLDPESGPAAALAHDLFNYPQARVLLLSATPYKAMTFAEEERVGADDHYRDLMATLGFLCDDEAWRRDVRATLLSYRQRLVHGEDTADQRARLRALLLRFMSRTERPHEAQQQMVKPMPEVVDSLHPKDVAGFVALRKTAHQLDAPMSVEYWKSAPYFINFTDGYQIGDKIRVALKDGQSLDGHLLHAQMLDPGRLDRYGNVDLGNARLRTLAEQTVGRGWWQLLWVPPSMPYYSLEGSYRKAATDRMTKRLIFSSWNATPTAIASLLSFEAEKHLARGSLDRRSDERARKRIPTRLRLRLRDGQPTTMNQFLLFWPHPGLAAACDPLTVAREEPDRVFQRREIEAHVRRGLRQVAAQGLFDESHSGAVRLWEAAARWGDTFAPGISHDAMLAALSGDTTVAETSDSEEDESSVLELHLKQLQEASQGMGPVAADFSDVAEHLTQMGLYAPGNIAWRSLARLIRENDDVSNAGHWRAAVTLAGGLWALFNRLESTLLLTQQDPGLDYWRTVLQQSAKGCLQAVVDEYLHHLSGNRAAIGMDDDSLIRLAQEAAEAIALRPSGHRAFDPTNPSEPIPLPSRFALRYGGTQVDSDSARPSEVRAAFNSPFWPFVLATTSAGQEGIDFHWWCSAIVHWNVPANPVDFEQREGRVHRFGGHAIRRNVAAKHRTEALASGATDPWKAAYDAARRQSTLGDFAPYWVYPGPAHVERHVLSFPLSRDEPKYRTVVRDLATYRMAFGQPRQEDLLSLLDDIGSDSETTPQTIDLKPPGDSADSDF